MLMTRFTCWKKQFSRKFKHFRKSENGASAVEYALLVSLLALATTAALTKTGDSLEANYKTLASALDTGSATAFGGVGGDVRAAGRPSYAPPPPELVGPVEVKCRYL